MRASFIVLFLMSVIVFNSNLVGQNVGVGTNTPQSSLSIKGNSTVGSNYANTPAPSDGLLIEGDVGVGTTSPNGKLHVADGVADTVLIVEPGNGKYAAKLNGFVDITGAIKNTGTKYDGSVAVNDGLTVGDLSGTQCTPATPTNCTFNYIDGTGSFQIDPNEPPFATSNYPTCNQGQCRSITSFAFTGKFFDFSFLAIKVDIYILNQFQYKVLIADAMDSTWTINFTSNSFNGQDPASISNWSVLMAGYDPSGDSDRCTEYTGQVNYNWADSSSISYYAAFGEVRASGTLYANSNNPYGDVAEFFAVTGETRQPEPGDIVSISLNTPQAFELTNKASDPLLAGVISENPSVFINDPSMGEPIALTGRVKVKVNAEGGKINPGDPITSSSTLAEGMKLNHKGMIVGYALEAYDGKPGETGKIWILLDKGHYEKVAPITPTYAAEGVNLGGIEVKGSMKVASNQKDVFIAWKDIVTGNIPADIDYEDLVVDMNAFGGTANLWVDKISAEGIHIGVSKKSSGFKGFYYTINLVSPALYQEPGVVEENEPVASNDVAKFIEIYNKWESTITKLIQNSGMDFSGVSSSMTHEEVKQAKEIVLSAWAKTDKKLYNQYLALGKQIQEMLNNPEIASAVNSMEKL